MEHLLFADNCRPGWLKYVYPDRRKAVEDPKMQPVKGRDDRFHKNNIPGNLEKDPRWMHLLLHPGAI